MDGKGLISLTTAIDTIATHSRFLILSIPNNEMSRKSPFAIQKALQGIGEGCGSPVVKVSNHGRHVMSSIQVPLKTRRVGQRCTLNLSRAETSSRWCGVVVRRGGASSGVVHVTL
ncbi:uncharacterized protein TNCV_1024331 [Trichonephila clavipes]|nr:uncharacterized protein TNCV_1024331 [Trichonephila clavipes]